MLRPPRTQSSRLTRLCPETAFSEIPSESRQDFRLFAPAFFDGTKVLTTSTTPFGTKPSRKRGASAPLAPPRDRTRPTNSRNKPPLAGTAGQSQPADSSRRTAGALGPPAPPAPSRRRWLESSRAYSSAKNLIKSVDVTIPTNFSLSTTGNA